MKFLSVSEFCELARISRALFYKLVSEGKRPRITKISRRKLISLRPSGLEDRWKGKLYTPLGKAVRCVGRAEQLIRNWLPATGVSFVLAQFSVGKTLLLLDQALCLATDCDWMGYSTSPGRFAIYLSGEDQEGTLANAEAWCAQHGLNLNDLPTPIIFAPITPTPLITKDCN